MHASGKWEAYEPDPTAQNLERAVAFVEEDKYGCFLGEFPSVDNLQAASKKNLKQPPQAHAMSLATSIIHTTASHRCTSPI
jgi:hypothetical protein